MKSVLVIGGHGFIGRAVVSELGRIGVNHKIATRKQQLPTEIELDISKIPKGFKFEDFSHIVNCAGLTSGTLEALLIANVQGPSNLMTRLTQLEFAPKLTLIGSAAEIGQRHSGPFGEDVPLHPITDYGRTKALQTELMINFASKGLDVNLARVFNVEGDDSLENSLFGSIRNQLSLQSQKPSKIVKLGNLDAIRDYLPINEVARRILAISFAGKSGEVYNVCSGKGISVREMVKAKFGSSSNSPIKFEEAQGSGSSKSEGIEYSVGDPDKTDRLLESL